MTRTKRTTRTKKNKKDDEDGDDESKKRKRGDDDDDARDRRKREGRPTQSDPRSRNLFGKLLGHLHSAKDRLQKEKSTKAGELKQKALGRVEEKVNMNRMNIKTFRSSQYAKQIEEEQTKISEIDQQIAEKELLLLQRRLESHYSVMMNFIRTKAQPTIFFMPAKHTRDTEKQLEDTRTAIKHKISSLKVQLHKTEDDVDPEEAMRGSAAAAALAAAEEGSGAKASKDEEPEAEAAGNKKEDTRKEKDKDDDANDDGKDAKEEKDEKDDKQKDDGKDEEKDAADDEPPKKKQKNEKGNSDSEAS